MASTTGSKCRRRASQAPLNTEGREAQLPVVGGFPHIRDTASSYLKKRCIAYCSKHI